MKVGDLVRYKMVDSIIGQPTAIVMSKMRIWHISDTHQYHDQLEIPDNIDLAIHSGDATNWRDPFRNEPEMHKFLAWFTMLDIPTKIFCAGNHDTSLEKGLITKEQIEACDIHYLFNEAIKIDGFKIWGSPYTPTFGNWAFMKSRQKIRKVWEIIPNDTDIIITHGPPKGILDLTWRTNNQAEMCGDISLLKRIREIKPKLVCFGHIHNAKDIYNSGTKQINGLDTIFSNGTCSTDNMWGKATSNGNIIEL